MNPEPNTATPNRPSLRTSSANGAMAASASHLTGAPKHLPFPWKAGTDVAEQDRVDIKQQAVLDGLRLGEKLSNILRNHIGGQNHRLGAEELADWPEQFDDVKEQYEKPHATVGLIGALGAGKTTLLNAMLGEQDLLPASSDRAGTATACKIVYNHGPDGYRAQIRFRSRKSFIEELNQLFRSLGEKRELQERSEEDLGDTERQEVEDQLEDIDATTSGTLHTILLLFGIKEEDLDITSTEEFLMTHPLILLGTTTEISETNREIFVNKVKPFMDSTPADWAGELLMIWPLIDHVTIFVKSDILKYGLELLDLPGLGDVEESRSKVAERFSQHLDITAVVASTHRATEEKAVTGFIKKRQETEMKMNGKFDRNSLCVILSKGEDLDPNHYLRSKWIARDYPYIPGYVDRAKALDKCIRTAESGHGRSQHETQENDITAQSTDTEVEKARQELLPLRESLKQAAVHIRNRVVVERVQKDFRERQATTKSNEDDQVPADTVEVFPTSARSFQGLRHDGGVEEAGFPTEIHTGIPRLQQWVFEATLKKRENHLDASLNQLLTLFSEIQTWISVNEDATVLSATEKQDHDGIHERHCRVRITYRYLPIECAFANLDLEQSLTTLLRQCGEEIKQIQPLKAKTVAIAECQKEYPRIIDRWRYRYPDKPNSALKIFGNIQTCILRKRGDFHQSKGKYSYKYQWIDDLAGVFAGQILNDWSYAFAVVVPGYEVEIQKSLEHVWKRYMTALNSFCADHNAPHLRDTGKIQQIIENAEEHLGIRAHQELTKLQNGAQQVHPCFWKEIQRLMTPAFEEAYSIKGEGCVRKRDEVLKQFAAEHSADLPILACEKMESELEDLIQQVCSSLEGVAADAISMVEKQMKQLLRIDKPCSSPAARASRKKLAKEIRPHLASWNLCWKHPPQQRDDHVMRGDLSIPHPDLIPVKDVESGV